MKRLLDSGEIFLTLPSLEDHGYAIHTRELGEGEARRVIVLMQSRCDGCARKGEQLLKVLMHNHHADMDQDCVG